MSVLNSKANLTAFAAEPLCFLDYYATGKLNVDWAEEFVKGVAEGCRQSHCALIGGETAEIPGVYGSGVFDAAGCAIGALKAGQKALPLKERMKRGDLLLGLASSGPHSNGYSLLRKIVERSGLSYTDACPWDNKKTLGKALLQPTKVYVKSLLEIVKRSRDEPLIAGVAHITGGGLTENIPRVLPGNLAARLDGSSWPVPASLRWLKNTGGVDDSEFARVFNAGIGMVVVVDPANADGVTQSLVNAGETVYRIGELQLRKTEGVVFERMDSWNCR